MDRKWVAVGLFSFGVMFSLYGFLFPQELPVNKSLWYGIGFVYASTVAVSELTDKYTDETTSFVALFVFLNTFLVTTYFTYRTGARTPQFDFYTYVTTLDFLVLFAMTYVAAIGAAPAVLVRGGLEALLLIPYFAGALDGIREGHPFGARVVFATHLGTLLIGCVAGGPLYWYLERTKQSR